MNPDAVSKQLCLACGLCCNGVLFKDVKLTSTDDLGLLKAAGLSLRSLPGKAAIPQPCSGLCADNRCRVYDHRPNRCQAFECALFKAVAGDGVRLRSALQTVGTARRQVDKVRRLLRINGDSNEATPLSLRFRKLHFRFERSETDAEAVASFGRLTLAMHALNVILSTHFYPGSATED